MTAVGKAGNQVTWNHFFVWWGMLQLATFPVKGPVRTHPTHNPNPIFAAAGYNVRVTWAGKLRDIRVQARIRRKRKGYNASL